MILIFNDYDTKKIQKSFLELYKSEHEEKHENKRDGYPTNAQENKKERQERHSGKYADVIKSRFGIDEIYNHQNDQRYQGRNTKSKNEITWRKGETGFVGIVILQPPEQDQYNCIVNDIKDKNSAIHVGEPG